MKLKKYMSSCHLYNKDNWMDAVQWAKDNGFDGVELFGGEGEREFGDLPPERLEKIADFALKSGIELSLHPWTDWSGLTEDALRQKFVSYAEKCAGMGMKYLNMHMQFVTTRESGMERLLRATDEALPVLKKAGVILLYENVPPHGIRELGSETGDFQRLFSYYKDEDAVMLNIDTGHAHITGTLELLCKENPSRWAYTHINDNYGVNDDHVAPGDGTLDFDLAARCAHEVGYTGPLMMEFHEKGLETGLKTLSAAYGKYGYQL